jgi:hypothetical protein
VFKKRAIIKYKSKNENFNDMMLFKNLETFEKRINISGNDFFKAIFVKKT